MSEDITGQARRLRDAHVDFLLKQCRGQALRRLIRLQVEGIIDDLSPLKLESLVDVETLKSVVVITVQKLDLGPELAELVGVIARHMYDHPIHDETTLSDILPDVALEVLFDQLLGLEDLRRATIHELVTNPVFQGLVTDLLLQGIGDFVASSTGMNKVPGAQSAMKLGKDLVKRATAGKTGGEDLLRKFVSRHMQASIAASEQFLNEAFESGSVREGASRVWEHMRDVPLSEFRNLVSVQQVEDIAMLGTAFWREFRGCDFMAAMLEAAVEGFYARHAGNPVSVILDEIGVTPDLWRTVLSQVLPEVLQNLESAGVLRGMLERLLDDFYASDALQQVLA